MIIRGGRLRALSTIAAQNRLTKAEIHNFQNRQLRRLVTRAYSKSDFYRQLFKSHGLKPDDIRTVKHLPLIPLTSKDDLRGTPLKNVLTLSARPDCLIRRKTSGSSGKPFTIYRTPLEDHLLNLFRIRVRQGYGMRISDNIATIRELRLVQDKFSILTSVKKALNLYTTTIIDCYSDDSEIISSLESIQPQIITGYPSTLARIGSIFENRRRIGISPRFVTTGGGVMTAAMRRRIEDGFQVPVFDLYGSHEFNILAWECPDHHGYHVSENNVILEILKDGQPAGPGESGEVVATGLHTLAMPFIRYQTGDIATRGHENCLCGSSFSTIENIQGRTIDYFKLAGGKVMHPYEITAHLIGAENSWISQHQMVQETETDIVLKIKPCLIPGNDDLVRLQHLGQEKLGRNIVFRVELVNDFKHQAGQKFNPYISLVNQNAVRKDSEG